MVYSDAAFSVGSTHQICQDYAAVGGREESALVAALSDGCSSVDQTDIGARALVTSAIRVLPSANLAAPAELERLLALEAIRAAAAFDAPPDATSATLMCVVKTPEVWEILCWGDGIVGRRYRDGVIEIDVLEQPEERPYYPYYSLLGVHQEPGLTKTVVTIGPNGSIQSGPVPMHGTLYRKRLNPADVDLVFVGSDGWSTFFEKGSGRREDFVDTLLKIFPFNSSGPSFLRRRMASFERTQLREGLFHADDLSIAGILHREDAS